MPLETEEEERGKGSGRKDKGGMDERKEFLLMDSERQFPPL